jgi:hypothetical protein
MKQHIRFKSKEFLQARCGNSGVEFALVLPILMILLFGSIELGRALHDYQVVNESVRDAARYLGRSPVDCTSATAGSCSTCDPTDGSCSGSGCTFVDADDVLDAVELAMTGDTDGGSNLLGYWQHPPTNASDFDIQVCGSDVANVGGLYDSSVNPDWNGVVPSVRLQANVDFTFLFGELVTPDATIDFNIAHKVVVVGE